MKPDLPSRNTECPLRERQPRSPRQSVPQTQLPGKVEEQVKTFFSHTGENDAPPVTLVTRDNDHIYGKAFDSAFEQHGVQIRKVAIRAPNTNAYVERFIQSLQVECLDQFLTFGEKHLDYLVREYVEHYHEERPHQGLENRRIGDGAKGDDGCDPSRLAEVQRRSRLGGLLNHYRSAA